MLAQLRVFLVALEEGSLNKAAARLRMSQSALSRQMQALEQEIGGALLERTSSGVRPTDAGHVLAHALPRALEEIDSAIAEARRVAQGRREILRVGYLGSAAQSFLDPALTLLRQSHPEVKVKLLDLSPGEQIAALRQGEIDLGIAGQEASMASTEFYTRSLLKLPFVAVLPADHPLAGKKSLQLKELRGERFLGTPEEDVPGRDRWITQLCRRAGFRPRFGDVAGTVSQMFSLVAGEGAVALAPGYLKSFPAAGVALVPVAGLEKSWDLLVIWQRGRTGSALRALLDALSTAAIEYGAKA